MSSGYEQYIDQHNRSVDAEYSEYEAYDKLVVGLATGGIGLSLALLKFIFTNPVSSSQLALTSTWIFFGSSLLSVLLSHWFSQNAIRQQRQEAAIALKDKSEKPTKDYGRWVRRANTSSILFIVVGIASLITFSVQNVRGNMMVTKSGEETNVVKDIETGTKNVDVSRPNFYNGKVPAEPPLTTSELDEKPAQSDEDKK